jgi:UDP-N-acetylglucosamine 3-dehydrogenase
MTRLRAGLIGLGSMGRNHCRLLRDLDEVDFIAACDPAGDPAGAANGTPVLATVEQLLDHDLDICVLAAPTDLHEAIAIKLAEAGVATLIEKPLAADVTAAERIVEAFDDRGVIGAVGHVERFNPALRELRCRLSDGQIGDVYQIATRRQSPFPARIRDVGVVFDLASHDLDLASWVAQERFSSVSAQMTHRSGREHEDLIAIVGRLSNGVITNHLVNWLTPYKERTTVVTGEFGSFVADTLNADLTFHRNGSIRAEWDTMAVFKGVSEGDSMRYAIAKPEPLRVELQAFINAVQGGDDSAIVTLQEGLHVVRVAAAVLDSAARNGEMSSIDGVNDQ